MRSGARGHLLQVRSSGGACRRRRGLLGLAWLLVWLLAWPAAGATAAPTFELAEPDRLQQTGALIAASLTEFQEPAASCVVQVVLDASGAALLRPASLRAYGEAVIQGFQATAFGKGCRYQLRDLTGAATPAQGLADLTAALGRTEPDSVLVQTAFYQTGEGVMAFAKLERLDGSFIASSGRIDLPVRRLPHGAPPPAEQARPAPAPLTAPPQPASPSLAEPLPWPTTTLRLNGASLPIEVLAPDLARAFLRSQVGAAGDPGIELVESATPDKPRERRLRLAEPPRGGQPVPQIELYRSDSTAALAALLEGDADIALTTRAITDAEAAAFAERHQTDMTLPTAEHVIGLDALEIRVAAGNRLAVVSRGTLAEIYGRAAIAWDQATLTGSGLAGPISSLAVRADAADDDSFAALVMAGSPPQPSRHFAEAGELAAAIGQDQRSIGYASIALPRTGRPVDLQECGLIMPPDRFLIATEDYPLTRRLYAYVNPAVTDAQRAAFLTFLLGTGADQGQAVLDRHLVDLRVRTAPPALDRWRWQTVGEQPTRQPELRNRYRAAIKTATRLSTTFRFRAGSRLALDSRGERDIAALAAKLAAERIAPERLLLFGFADAAGDAGGNRRLAGKRAELVAERLAAAGVQLDRRAVVGIGEEAPIACNYQPDGSADALGQARNRRVEVWLKAPG